MLVKTGAAAAMMLVMVAVAGPAHAALGEARSSVLQDRDALQGALTVRTKSQYEVHDIAMASGAMVHEYVSPNGRVFAVTWSTSQTPDLEVLLGASYDRFVAEARNHRTGHHVLSIATPDLVMSVTKTQRSSVGRVFVPALMPSGTSRAELQ